MASSGEPAGAGATPEVHAAPAAVAAPTGDGPDYFHRQRRVPGWDDAWIARQVALVFGAGGIGCSVAMCLGRLGVAEIILLDRDTVDATNLNRQLLFAPKHVRSRVGGGGGGERGGSGIWRSPRMCRLTPGPIAPRVGAGSAPSQCIRRPSLSHIASHA
jgi:hypothetical protein